LLAGQYFGPRVALDRDRRGRHAGDPQHLADLHRVGAGRGAFDIDAVVGVLDDVVREHERAVGAVDDVDAVAVILAVERDVVVDDPDVFAAVDPDAADLRRSETGSVVGDEVVEDEDRIFARVERHALHAHAVGRVVFDVVGDDLGAGVAVEAVFAVDRDPVVGVAQAEEGTDAVLTDRVVGDQVFAAAFEGDAGAGAQPIEAVGDDDVVPDLHARAGKAVDAVFTVANDEIACGAANHKRIFAIEVAGDAVEVDADVVFADHVVVDDGAGQVGGQAGVEVVAGVDAIRVAREQKVTDRGVRRRAIDEDARAVLTEAGDFAAVREVYVVHAVADGEAVVERIAQSVCDVELAGGAGRRGRRDQDAVEVLAHARAADIAAKRDRAGAGRERQRAAAVFAEDIVDELDVACAGVGIHLHLRPAEDLRHAAKLDAFVGGPDHKGIAKAGVVQKGKLRTEEHTEITPNRPGLRDVDVIEDPRRLDAGLHFEGCVDRAAITDLEHLASESAFVLHHNRVHG